MSQGLKFGYFKVQGRGQIARLLLAYTKTEYKQVGYSFSKMADWTQKDKVTLGLDFPTLPYLIDGNFKLAQSRAIEKYIIHRAKRTDLLGKNSKETALIDNIYGVLLEIFDKLTSLFYALDFQESRKKIFPTLDQKLSNINAYIETKNYLLNRLTYVDFVLTVVFGYFKFFYPYEFNKWTNIIRVIDLVNNLSEIQAYYNSGEAVSNLMVLEMANDPRWSNLKPMNQEQKEQLPLQIQTESKTQQELQINEPKEEQPLIKNIQQLSTPPALCQETQTQNIQTQSVVKQVQSNVEKKHFNTRVEQYRRAVEAANLKGSSQFKSDLHKSTIVTPSKIESSIITQRTSDIAWKIQSQTEQNNQTQTPSSICLGYWGIRGLGQVQRHLLTYCGHEFTEKIYNTREEWFNADKLTLNLPFPNLPYLIAGDLKLTESLAIDRYIIRTSGKVQLLGKTLHDQALMQNIVKILSELFAEVRAFCFAENDEDKKKILASKLQTAFQRLNEFIQNKQYAFGYLTLTDFYLAEISHYVEQIFPELYSKYSFLKNIRQSVDKNSEIQKYYQKNESVKGPFMPPTAKISF